MKLCAAITLYFCALTMGVCIATIIGFIEGYKLLHCFLAPINLATMILLGAFLSKHE